MIYKSYSELLGHTLYHYDTVIFYINNSVYPYTVYDSWLSYNYGNNDIIFKKLIIKDPIKFCKNSYGYYPNLGFFPTANRNDYIALTKVTLDLFKLCDNFHYKLTNIKII